MLDDGRIGSGGFIFKDGRNIPIESIRVVEHSYGERGIFPLSTVLEIVDKEGREYNLKAKPGPIVPVPFKGDDGELSFLIQSFGSFELDDLKGGYGSYEVLRKSRN